MCENTTTVKILERCQISPPPGSVPPTNLPLTFFDITFLVPIFIRRLFFFDLPLPTDTFTLTVLPKLKHSLSLALRHFFPFASVLVRPAPPHKAHLLFSEGGSVSFTVAESTVHFDHLLSNDPRDVTACHPFVPTLQPPSSHGVSPILAVQVTVFPNSGVAIGLTFDHVAADGRASNHFVKSWAFICRTISSKEQESPYVDFESPPCHDRDIILDPYGLEPILLKDWWDMTGLGSRKEGTARHIENMSRATFVMGQAHIAKLKQFVMGRCNDKGETLTWHLSTFVVAVAYTWVQLVKSQQETESIRDGDETYHLTFQADCRSRSGMEYQIPDTYFGNCLSFCRVSLKRSELVEFFCAAKAIGEKIKEYNEAPLRGADKWVSNWKERSDNWVVIMGSPKLRVYDTDFGWGRPRKSQVVNTSVLPTILLSECKDGGEGIEIGLSLDKDKMEIFNASFQQGLEFR